jgi:anti-anti-sigma factor
VLKMRACEPEMHIRVSMEGEGTCVVQCAGDVDIEGAPELHAALELGLREARQKLILDLRDVSSMDSAAVGEIVKARNHLANGVAMSVCTGNARLRMLLEMAGLTRRSTSQAPAA